jgi:hypothetical protein
MKRYISVPLKEVTNGIMPESAVRLGRLFSLEIRTDENCEEVKIVSEPNIKKITHDELYSVGKIWSLDIHDEFIDMSKNCYIKIEDDIFYPKIKESHILKFRVRPRKHNNCKFSVYINDEKYLTSEILEK